MQGLLFALVVSFWTCFVVASTESELSVTTVNGRTARAGELIFEDNFDILDFGKWQHELTLSGGGNWEFQGYLNNRSNSYTRDGILYIKPTYTEELLGPGSLQSVRWDLHGSTPADRCTAGNFYGCERVGNPTNILNPIVSARLRSAESFSFKFGRVEIRARMPRGDWLWPAIWMLPRYQDYGQWPASGEIDIVESRGNSGLMLNGVNIGAEQVSQTLHWGPHFFLNQYEKTSWSKNSVPGYDSDFHIYGLEWTPDYISLTIDSVETGRVEPPANGFWEYGAFPAGQDNPWVGATKLAPFDQEFYFIMNLAVGGTNSFFPDEAVNSGPPKPWSNQSPQALLDFWNARGSWESTWVGEEAALKVDYVRVYAL